MTFRIVICFLLFYLPSGISLHSGKHEVHRTRSNHMLAIFLHSFSGMLSYGDTQFSFKYCTFLPVQLHSLSVNFPREADGMLSPCPMILLQTLRSRPALAFSPEKVRTHARRSSSRLSFLSMGILMMCLLYFLLDTWFLSNVKLAARIATGNTTVQIYEGLSTSPPPPFSLSFARIGSDEDFSLCSLF